MPFQIRRKEEGERGKREKKRKREVTAVIRKVPVDQQKKETFCRDHIRYGLLLLTLTSLKSVKTWTCARQSSLVGSTNCLTLGTEQVEWFMDQTITTTDNNVLIKLFSFVLIQADFVKI